ncbi:hypothetical protein [Streptomyces sp. UNOC14_S4]|uniref:hypothetical protein n=1 Tax=Streptomyces sp. UNOC14_S4 TaxID=2872340 RepID=UPI001E5A3C75|nr:hypothetical protein [Streptomyces sp. UNOC14_S4]MCC3771711.1 hypothetical protein [Streptomyces sp. UNOC14_S4]
MSHITWEDAFCGEAANCFRIGIDSLGNAYIAVSGAEEYYVTDTRDALRALIRDIKAGRVDHLL